MNQGLSVHHLFISMSIFTNTDSFTKINIVTLELFAFWDITLNNAITSEKY
jgi:hypothetical protein